LTVTFLSNAITGSVTVTPVSKITYAVTNYAFAIQLNDKIPSQGSIMIQFPSAISFSSPSLVTASFSTTSCILNTYSSNRTLTLSNCFSSDMTTLSVSITIGGIINPSSLQPTNTFVIRTFGAIG
jgi:hypothetical protein